MQSKEEIREGKTRRNCDNCNRVYYADNRNLKRGWGLCCSKRCAASKREKDKPGYDAATVADNNYRREHGNRYHRRGAEYGTFDDEMYGNFSNEE